jgi:hypothetical protein
LKGFVNRRYPKNEEDVKLAIELYHLELQKPGKIYDDAMKSLDAFQKRLVTCIHLKGRIVNDVKDRHDAWIQHQINPVKVIVSTVENKPDSPSSPPP